MSDKENSNDENLMYNFFQLAIWIIILFLIFLRLYKYQALSNNWIWLINYVGMGIALLNLLVGKCFKLRQQKNKKYKPFVGFTTVVLILVCCLGIVVYFWQSSVYSQSVNDVITLFALFFSLSEHIWNFILDFLVKIIK